MARSSRGTRGSTGRGISFVGFALLFVCFFLPQIKACNLVTLVPAERAFDGGVANPLLDRLATVFLPFTLSLLVIILCLIRQALRSAKGRRFLTALLGLLALLTMIGGSLGLTAHCIDDNWARWTDPENPFEWTDEDTAYAIFLPAMFFFTALAVVIARRARRSVRSPAAVGFLGVFFALYFLLFACLYQPLYGIWVSITASGIIAVGGLSEAIATRRR